MYGDDPPRTPLQEYAEVASAPLPAPMIPGNFESLSDKCFIGQRFKDTVGTEIILVPLPVCPPLASSSSKPHHTSHPTLANPIITLLLLLLVVR